MHVCPRDQSCGTPLETDLPAWQQLPNTAGCHLHRRPCLLTGRPGYGADSCNLKVISTVRERWMLAPETGRPPWNDPTRP